MEDERFEQFWNLISGIHWDIERLKTKWTAPLGMKSVHIFWVYLLKDHPDGLTAAELSRLSQTNRSLVSREIQNLMDLGYVSSDSGNRRHYGQRLKLTPLGMDAARRISNASLQIQNQVNAEIPQEDLIVFYRTLETLKENFHRLAEQSLEVE